MSGASWSEFKNEVWTIPKERVKNGRAHSIPISPEVARLLDTVRYGDAPKEDRRDENEYLFHARRQGCISSRTIHLALQRIKVASGLKHFTAHDLRRTYATGLRRIGIPRETVARILNHTSRSVTLVYD